MASLELKISGLCAFVLNPCGNNPTSVSAVFPGGPFKYSNHEKYPEHYPVLTVDVTDVSPSSTAMCENVIMAADGSQFAVFKISGEVTLTIDGQIPKVKRGS